MLVVASILPKFNYLLRLDVNSQSVHGSVTSQLSGLGGQNVSQ